jgi:hypothetical protein
MLLMLLHGRDELLQLCFGSLERKSRVLHRWRGSRMMIELFVSLNDSQRIISGAPKAVNWLHGNCRSSLNVRSYNLLHEANHENILRVKDIDASNFGLMDFSQKTDHVPQTRMEFFEIIKSWERTAPIPEFPKSLDALTVHGF